MQETKVITFTVVDCATCHVPFGMYSDTVERLQHSGETFYCPSGHANWYGESDKAKLKRAIEEKEGLERALNASRETINYYKNAKDTAQMQLRAKKGQLTKLKNKIATGTCPSCSKDFPNLKKHIETEHPDFAQIEKNGNEN